MPAIQAASRIDVPFLEVRRVQKRYAPTSRGSKSGKQEQGVYDSPPEAPGLDRLKAIYGEALEAAYWGRDLG